jgi:hypothetical protein
MQNRLPPLATRLQTLLDEKFNKDTQQQQTLPLEHLPSEEERGIRGPPLFFFFFIHPLLLLEMGLCVLR